MTIILAIWTLSEINIVNVCNLLAIGTNLWNVIKRIEEIMKYLQPQFQILRSYPCSRYINTTEANSIRLCKDKCATINFNCNYKFTYIGDYSQRCEWLNVIGLK